jgi:hypothetical protein
LLLLTTRRTDIFDSRRTSKGVTFLLAITSVTKIYKAKKRRREDNIGRGLLVLDNITNIKRNNLHFSFLPPSEQTP